jgi:hypothetical protein
MSAELHRLRRQERRRFLTPQNQIEKIAKKNSVTQFRFHQQPQGRHNIYTVVWLWTSKGQCLSHGDTLETEELGQL